MAAIRCLLVHADLLADASTCHCRIVVDRAQDLGPEPWKVEQAKLGVQVPGL